MTDHQVRNCADWLAVREELLRYEKERARLGDELAPPPARGRGNSVCSMTSSSCRIDQHDSSFVGGETVRR